MRSTVAEIDKAKLLRNLKRVRMAAGNAEVMGIVKADAYGHGSLEISRLLRGAGMKILGTAFADEAVRLRQAGDTGEIFITIPGTEHDIDLYCAYNLQASIEDMEVLKLLSAEAVSRNMKIKSHLFINTGMNRDGIPAGSAVGFMKGASQLAGIEIIGILTHFASSELEDRTFALSQLKNFNNCIDKLMKAGFYFRYIHASNSGGVLNIPEANFNLVRSGIALYGYMDYPEMAEKWGLEPILSVKSKVININEINPGDTVGYSLNYISGDSRRIAVVPFGYGDGYHRTLSNKAQCLINGNRYNLVGTICMDQCLIDIGNDDVNIGDEVVLLGPQGADIITAYELADYIGTIPYEITTALKLRVPRVYI